MKSKTNNDELKMLPKGGRKKSNEINVFLLTQNVCVFF